MKNRVITIHGIRLILLILLTLGLKSCSPDKNIKLENEIKLKAPSIFKNKINKHVSISSISLDEFIDSSDRIQFNGFDVHPTNYPIQLISKTTCTHSNEERTLKTTRPFPSSIQISELLPIDYFVNPQNPNPHNLKCRFDFKALVLSSQANHSFSLNTNVTISPQTSPAIEFSHNQTLLTNSKEKITLKSQQLESSLLSSDRSDFFQLHCQHFIVELNLKENKPTVRKELWLNPKLISLMKEKPIQLCRILGYRQKLITSWSPYFYLQIPQDPPQLTWSLPTQKIVYWEDSEDSLNAMVANVQLYNSNTYSQLIRVHKNLPIHMIPQPVRSPDFLRIYQKNLTTEVTTKQKVEFVYEDNQYIVYKVFPHAELSMEYVLSGQLKCDCPSTYLDSRWSWGVQLLLAQFPFKKPSQFDLFCKQDKFLQYKSPIYDDYLSCKNQFFLLMPNPSLIAEIVAIKPYTDQEFQLLLPIEINPDPPLGSNYPPISSIKKNLNHSLLNSKAIPNNYWDTKDKKGVCLCDNSSK